MCQSLKTKSFVVNSFKEDKETGESTDTTVECWALAFKEFVNKQLVPGSASTYEEFPIQNKLKFYTLLVDFLNSGEGKHYVDEELLGVKYIKMNPKYEEAEKKGLPTDGIVRFLPPHRDAETGQLKLPKVIYA